MAQIDVTSGTEVLDDYSNTFHKIRAQLVSADGRRYPDFVRTLKPNFAKVRRDIALGYLALAASVALTHWLAFSLSFVLAVVLGALLVGYWIAYLQLFLHEGAHFNLAAEREASDRLTNGLVGWMVGADVANYRKVHFQHHRALGTVLDSEHTYFFPLNLLFVVKGLTGLRVFEVMASRRKFLEEVSRRKQERTQRQGAESEEADGAPDTPAVLDKVMLAGLFVHGAVVAASLYVGAYAVALAWIIGVCMVFPFFGALRQLLEHRDERADRNTDYFRVDHGAYSRMFGDDVLSATFGGAGFNRHLLHHWEPQLSYTNLKELERFFAATPLGEIIEKRRTTYPETFLRLFSLY